MNATVSARFGHADMCGTDRSLQDLFRYCVVFPSITGYDFRIENAPYVLQIASSGGEADIDPGFSSGKLGETTEKNRLQTQL